LTAAATVIEEGLSGNCSDEAGMALLTARASAQPATRVGLGRQLVARARSTPGRLISWLVVLLAIGLAVGVAGAVGSAQRSSLVDGVRTRSGPLAVQAQQLYRSLSDADATAASAFLSNGVEPAQLRTRYQSDITAAGAALAAAAAGTDSGQPAVHQLSAQLPVYTGLVETARTFNRLGLPVGAAYLREASALMRNQLLPAAERLYQLATDRLGAERGAAAALPWLVLLLGLATVAGLVWAQLWLSRRTHRTLNVGLVAATVSGLVMVGWIGVAWLGVSGHLEASSRDGSAQVALLAKARIAALQARADEALTLVARGNGASFEKDYTSQLDSLLSRDGNSGLLIRAREAATGNAVRITLDAAIADVKEWRTVHQKLRGLDDGGNFPDAVKLAIDASTGSAASIFNHLDGALGQGITITSGAFDRQAAAGADALGGQIAAIVMLTLLLAAGVTIGFQRRIAEYR
jgi:hypothetical protein